MKQHVPPAKSIYYAFDSTGLPDALAAAHIDYVKRALSALFCIDDSEVRAIARPRLSEGAPFQLTAYETDSRTSAVAMAVAAKAVLPHLHKTQRLASLVAGWVPGVDLAADEAGLAGVAGGGAAFTPDQRVWAEVQAQLLGEPAEEGDAALAAQVLEGWARDVAWLFRPR